MAPPPINHLITNCIHSPFSPGSKFWQSCCNANYLTIRRPCESIHSTFTAMHGCHHHAWPGSNILRRAPPRCYSWAGQQCCLTDSSMYLAKEVLCCQTGQLPEPPAEPQHLSDWLVEEESWELSEWASLWVRAQHVYLSKAIYLNVCDELENSTSIKSSDTLLRLFLTSTSTSISGQPSPLSWLWLLQLKNEQLLVYRGSRLRERELSLWCKLQARHERLHNSNAALTSHPPGCAHTHTLFTA